MKRIGLILLTFLLLVLPTVAQTPEKVAPDDLVVTAEIVGYSKSVIKGKDYYTLRAKMAIRNTANYSREINMMSCAFPESWVASSASGLLEPTFQPICDHNTPTIVTIPSGEAVVFNCPLLLIDAHVYNPEVLDEVVSFRLGFIDLTFRDVWDGFNEISHADRLLAKIQKARAVYWSNVITTQINLTTAEEITGADFYSHYVLTQNGK